MKEANSEKETSEKPVAQINSADSNIGKANSNRWVISTVILGLACLVLVAVIFGFGSATGNVVSQSDAGTKITDFLNGRVGGGVTFVSAEDMGDLYKVTVSYKGEDVPVYVSKDGKYFIQGLMPLDEQAAVNNQTQEAPKDIPKSDKPKAELFIMTHCPYGTQAEKGLIPALKALGTKADVTVRFVHYFMHGDKEEQETYTQVCIREEQKTKYIPYLECFLEDSNSTRCLAKAGISTAQLNTCVANKAKEYYAKDSELSNQYGVQGSPTLVINGVEASSGRDSASMLKTICSAFNTAPSECTKSVSSASPSPGFGYAAAAAGSASAAANCAS